jgi:hypothetical protein
MTRCFADTFFYLAFTNERDEAHQQAVDFIAAHNPLIVTTDWVLTEVGDAMASGGRSRFGELLNAIRDDGRTEIVPASHDLFDLGVDRYLARLDKDWSLTDCISFVVMRDRELTDALTGDRHFEQAGFRRLLAGA